MSIKEEFKKDLENLSNFEKQVIAQKGTERPFTSDLLEVKDDGVFICKLCKTPLFKSDSKFNSGTGWPSFDDAIEGAVEEVLDSDGRRVEIVCKNCGGHLGHVFRGENFTPKSTRHCVNGISLEFKKS